MDEIKIEILADGTIKSETGSLSGANHSNAEAFMKFLEELTGSKGTRTRRGHHSHGAHSHTHEEEKH